MKKLAIPISRVLGLMVGVCLLTGSVLAQSTQDSSKAMALTERLDKTKVSQDPNPAITLELDQVSLKKAIKRIAGQAEAGLYYNTAFLPKKNVSLRLQAVPLDEALRKVLEGTSLRVITSGRNITLRQKRETDLAQYSLANIQETITGTVTDAQSGETLPGVNILVEGTTTGASTDQKGQYELTTPSLQDTLIFTYIGYQRQEVPINGRTEINLAMQPQAISGEEMVVVGYGTQEERDVTGSVSSISAEKLEGQPITSVTEGLAGQVAGVQVQQTSGTPGAGLMVRVRGTGSITQGNEPLYVVDGYPLNNSDLSMINPKDIESIEVLKDASAAAIYGSRGGNGVVLITTKKGREGDTRVSFNMSTGFQEVTKKLDMMNTEQYVQWLKDGRNNAWIQEGGSADDPNSVRPEGNTYQIPQEYSDPSALPNTNWQDKIFRQALMQNYQLAVSGGNETTTFSFSGNFTDQDGIIKNTGFKRYSLRTNINSNVNESINIGLNISASRGNQRSGRTTGKTAATEYALVTPPVFPVYYPDGSYGESVAEPLLGGGDVSPVAQVNEIEDLNKKSRFRGQGFIEYEINENLQFKTELGADIYQLDNSYYHPSTVSQPGRLAPVPVDASSGSSEEVDWINENTLIYEAVLADKHKINALAGFTIQKNNSESSDIAATNFPNDKIHTLNAGQIVGGGTFKTKSSLMSFLSRVNYSYDERYLLTATVRRDGSSRFGEENKWGTFPSASVGWRISDEEFMDKFEFINHLKIRTSYGLTGNNSIPNYGSLGLLGNTRYVGGDGSIVNGIIPSTISNPNLGWEQTKQFDIGLEVGLFSDRVFIEADYYDSQTEDLLLEVPIPRITGYDSQFQNIGKVSNKGWEFVLNTRNLVGAFQWNTDFNISFNNNEVLELGPNDRPIYASAPNVPNGFKTMVGEPIANYYGYIFDGVYNSEEEINNHAHLETDTPGDPIIRDVNGDGELSADDRTLIGNNQPDFTFGLNNNFYFQNFNLRLLLTGSYGAEIFRLSSRFTDFYHGGRNARADLVNRWRSPQEPGSGEYFKANADYQGLQKEPSSYWVEDGSFLRIRNVQLGYTLPANLLDNIALRSAKVYMSIQNLATFTDYFGFDPQASTSGTGLTRGADYTAYPTARTISLGVNINF